MMPVRQTPDALLISIPTNDPGELREQLLKAITVVFKHTASHPIENKKEAELLTCLADLQNSLLPTASELKKLAV